MSRPATSTSCAPARPRVDYLVKINDGLDDSGTQHGMITDYRYDVSPVFSAVTGTDRVPLPNRRGLEFRSGSDRGTFGCLR